MDIRKVQIIEPSDACQHDANPDTIHFQGDVQMVCRDLAGDMETWVEGNDPDADAETIIGFMRWVAHEGFPLRLQPQQVRTLVAVFG